MTKILYRIWMKLPTRVIVRGVLVIMVTLLFFTTWNDTPTLDEADTLRQGYQITTYGKGLESFGAIGASLVASTWLRVVSVLGGFSVCFLECPGLSGLSAWQDVQGILLVSRIPFIFSLGLAILGMVRLVARHTRSRSSMIITAVLLCLSPTTLAFGGLIGNWSLSLLGVVIIIDLYLKARQKHRSLDWILLGVAASLGVFFVPILWGVVGLILVYWVLDWICIERQSANEQYFKALAGVSYWIVATLGLSQIAYGYLTRSMDEYRWYVVDGWVWLTEAFVPQEVFLFGQWFSDDWGVYTILTYILKEPFAILITLFLLLSMLVVWVFRTKVLGCAWMREHRFQLLVSWVLIGLIGGSLVMPGYTGVSSIWLPILLGYPLIAIGIRFLLVPWNISVWILLILGLWFVLIPFGAFPHYLSHTNLFTGKGKVSYLTFHGNTIDGGQDLYRLAQWTKSQDIGTIYVDYQGSIDPSVYLGEAYVPYTSEDGQKPDQYIAISVNAYHESFRKKDLGQINQDYWWLEWKHPQAQIGQSILIYRLPQHK